MRLRSVRTCGSLRGQAKRGCALRDSTLDSCPGGKMSYSENVPVLLTRHIRKLRGGSQPILAAANDGRLYVVKFNNNLQGPNLAFNESMGTELYRLCNLPVPSWTPILVTGSFLDENPGCWIETADGKLRPEEGLCFGSRFLCGENCRLLEILPGNSFKRVRNLCDFWLAWLLDICAGHADNRQAIFHQKPNGILDAFFIDHGHMFGGPKGECRVHFKAARYLDVRAYPDVSSKLVTTLRESTASIDPDQLWLRARGLPEDWKTVPALSKFAEALETLSKARLINNAIETMFDSLRRTSGIEIDDNQWGGPAAGSVLRLGIQAAGLRRPFIH